MKEENRQWDYYLCLICIVWPVRALVYISPIALLTLIANQYGLIGDLAIDQWTSGPWMIYFASECLFTMYYLYTTQRLAVRKRPPPRLMEELSKRKNAPQSIPLFLEKMIQHTSDLKTLVEEWFYDTPMEKLTRQDLRMWLAHIFYSSEWEDLDKKDQSEVDFMVTRLYEEANVQETNATPTTKPNPCVRHTLDEFHTEPRTWLIYACTFSLSAMAYVFLRAAGFKRYNLSKGQHYWHRGAMTTPVADPLVFIHGIGAGLMLYFPLLWYILTTHQNRAIVLLDSPYVSMQLVEDVPTMAETLDGLRRMLQEHNIDKAHWMGHSLGTAICSWVCQQIPEAVSHVTFIDPIVFYLWKRDVAYNFLYRRPSNGLQVLLWYFASSEMHIVHVMRRHFWWYNIVCFPEHLPRDPVTNHVAASVFLSSHDLIINAREVHGHLLRAMQSSEGHIAPHDMIETVWWDGLTHGEMLLHGHALTTVTSNVRCRDVTKTVKHVAKWNWADYIVHRFLLSGEAEIAPRAV